MVSSLMPCLAGGKSGEVHAIPHTAAARCTVPCQLSHVVPALQTVRGTPLGLTSDYSTCSPWSEVQIAYATFTAVMWHEMSYW